MLRHSTSAPQGRFLLHGASIRHRWQPGHPGPAHPRNDPLGFRRLRGHRPLFWGIQVPRQAHFLHPPRRNRHFGLPILGALSAAGDRVPWQIYRMAGLHLRRPASRWHRVGASLRGGAQRPWQCWCRHHSLGDAVGPAYRPVLHLHRHRQPDARHGNRRRPTSQVRPSEPRRNACLRHRFRHVRLLRGSFPGKNSDRLACGCFKLWRRGRLLLRLRRRLRRIPRRRRPQGDSRQGRRHCRLPYVRLLLPPSPCPELRFRKLAFRRSLPSPRPLVHPRFLPLQARLPEGQGWPLWPFDSSVGRHPHHHFLRFADVVPSRNLHFRQERPIHVPRQKHQSRQSDLALGAC